MRARHAAAGHGWRRIPAPRCSSPVSQISRYLHCIYILIYIHIRYISPLPRTFDAALPWLVIVMSRAAATASCNWSASQHRVASNLWNCVVLYLPRSTTCMLLSFLLCDASSADICCGVPCGFPSRVSACYVDTYVCTKGKNKQNQVSDPPRAPLCIICTL